MTVRLDDRVALITGAGSGLGRLHALLLAKLGAKIIVNDLGSAVSGEGASRSAAEGVVDEIRSFGGQAIANYDSVTEHEAAERMVAQTIEAFGRIDIVVNNAGILRDKSFAKMTADDFESVIKVHLTGAFNVTHAAWKPMLDQGYGRVVFTTSAAGHNGNFGQANYGAAKLGLVGMMNCLAMEGARKNVHVNCISPAAVTRMTESIPIGRLAEYLRADLIPPALAWLVSDACQQSGLILTALGGHYGSVHYVESIGAQFDPEVEVTVDMIAGVSELMLDMTDALPTPPGPLGRITDHLVALGKEL